MTVHSSQPQHSILKFKTTNESLAVNYKSVGSNSNANGKSNKTHQVEFDRATVFVFLMEPSCNPSVNRGPAVEIGWKPIKVYSDIPVDELEEKNNHENETSRTYSSSSSINGGVNHAYRMQSKHRVRILLENGFSQDEIKDATKTCLEGKIDHERTLDKLRYERREELLETWQDLLSCKRSETLLYPETVPLTPPIVESRDTAATPMDHALQSNKRQDDNNLPPPQAGKERPTDETLPKERKEEAPVVTRISRADKPPLLCIFEAQPCKECCKRALADTDTTVVQMYKCKGNCQKLNVVDKSRGVHETYRRMRRTSRTDLVEALQTLVPTELMPAAEETEQDDEQEMEA